MLPVASRQELVSVVMPVRNGGALLAGAVESILGQSWERLELIVVNDNSADAAISDLPTDDTRLRITDSDGEGVVSAFNTGMRLAQGSFIARMDGDDIALPKRLELQMELLAARSEIAIAGGCVELFSADGLGEGNRHYQRWLNNLREPADISREMFIESPVPNPTALFRRSVIETLGGYNDTEWPEDYDLFLRADRMGLEIAKPGPVVLRWRDHDHRLTRKDSRYSRSRFQAAKAHYLAHGRLPQTTDLLIWGAGDSGREMHDLLIAEGAAVAGFVDVHPRRIGGQKRGLPVWPIDKAMHWQSGPVLVAVGARGAREEIRAWYQEGGRCEGRDYLFVC